MSVLSWREPFEGCKGCLSLGCVMGFYDVMNDFAWFRVRHCKRDRAVYFG